MRTPRSIKLFGLSLAVAAMLPAAPAREVSLYVTVEKNGSLVSGLTEQNFRLWENGDARSFRLEKPEKPAAVALLVEHSQSSWFYLNDIVSAMRGFLSEAPEGNYYALAVFSNKLKVEVDFTRQKGRVPAAFSELDRPLWDMVNTYDAVYEMLDKMGRMSGRRVLIFIGSGFDHFSGATLEDVQRKAEQANVVVYGVGTGSAFRGIYERYLGPTDRLRLLQAEAFLQMLADKTGGEAWFPRFEAAFPNVMRGIMQSLEHQYRLVYTSAVPRDGRFYEIKLEAFRLVDDRRDDFTVRVREGWRF